MSRFQRTALLLGEDALIRLQQAHICVIGLGGVGSYAAEALARSGVGNLTLIDHDVVAESNCNRQLCALSSTLGIPKAEVIAARIRQIHPDCTVTPHVMRYTGASIDLSGFTYLADAIDSVPDKLQLIEHAAQTGIPILSCMGTGNKLDPTQLRVADIEKTYGCPLAKTIRLRLRKMGIRRLQVVFSPEPAIKPERTDADSTGSAVGSVAWVPSSAGLLMAGTIIQNILGNKLSAPKQFLPKADRNI